MRRGADPVIVAALFLLAMLALTFLFGGLVMLIWGVGMRFVMFAYGFCCPEDKAPNP